MKEPLPLLVPQEVEKWYKLKCYCSLYTRTLHLLEGFSFPIAASPLTDDGYKENNPLALRVKPGFKRSKALLHLSRLSPRSRNFGQEKRPYLLASTSNARQMWVKEITCLQPLSGKLINLHQVWTAVLKQEIIKVGDQDAAKTMCRYSKKFPGLTNWPWGCLQTVISYVSELKDKFALSLRSKNLN